MFKDVGIAWVRLARGGVCGAVECRLGRGGLIVLDGIRLDGLADGGACQLHGLRGVCSLCLAYEVDALEGLLGLAAKRV